MSSLVGEDGPQVVNPFGPLTPANGWYPLQSSSTDIKLSCAFLGLFCGITGSMITDAVRATRIWRRPFFTTFKVLVWTQIISSIAFQGIVFGYLNGNLSPTFGLFFAIIIFWCLNSSVVTQVQVNRVSILVTSEKHKKIYKWTLAGVLLIVDIVVCCTWLPVRLQVKAATGLTKALLPIDILAMLILAAADLTANIWFVRTINKRLTSLGLTKYDAIVRYNVITLSVSLCLDGVVIGMMLSVLPSVAACDMAEVSVNSYPNGFLYMSLFPIIYQVKLNIELGLSDLIVKVASEKAVHRVNDMSRFEAADAIAGHIKVAVEEETETHKDDPLGLQPTFGQLIKRPEWANRSKRQQEPSSPTSSSEDGEKHIGIGGIEMQAVTVRLQGPDGEEPKDGDSRSGSTWSLK